MTDAISRLQSQRDDVYYRFQSAALAASRLREQAGDMREHADALGLALAGMDRELSQLAIK